MILRKVKKAIRILRDDGIAATIAAARREAAKAQDDKEYRKWIAKYDLLSRKSKAATESAAARFEYKPVISIVMPVYNVEESFLREALNSVRDQLYENWELCIADDHSTEPHVRRILEEFAESDARIKIVFREKNGHISAASNTAFSLVTGEFTALMDHDDILTEDALFEVVKLMNEQSETDLIYTDEDKIDENGRRFQPMFKPDWSPELFYSLNLLTHLCVFRTALMRQIGGFREGFEGSQDYDLSLRFLEKTVPDRIKHIPLVLYHWRAIKGSVALDGEEKNYAHERARLALTEHYERTGVAATAGRGISQTHRPVFRLSAKPSITVIVFRGHGSDLLSKEMFAGHKVVEFITAGGEGPEAVGRFAQMNEAAARAKGEVLVFLDGSTSRANQGALEELLGRAVRDGVGAVGGKIVDDHNCVIHAGYILGINEGVGNVFRGEAANSRGRYLRLSVDLNLSAVSANCLAVQRSLFENFGGFDAEAFPETYADIDFCLRMASSGHRTVWTPWAVFKQADLGTEKNDAELAELKRRWPAAFAWDPYYNPNLSITSAAYSLAYPPRRRRFSKIAA